MSETTVSIIDDTTTSHGKTFDLSGNPQTTESQQIVALEMAVDAVLPTCPAFMRGYEHRRAVFFAIAKHLKDEYERHLHMTPQKLKEPDWLLHFQWLSRNTGGDLGQIKEMYEKACRELGHDL